MTRLYPGSTSHLILTVACAEPLTESDLLDRLALRGHFPEEQTAYEALHRHKKTGLLRVAAQIIQRREGGGAGRVNLYVLTPEGEAALDEVWRAA